MQYVIRPLLLALCIPPLTALSQPRIEWVTPPAWVQTPNSMAPAKPGHQLSSAAWVSTGRDGSVYMTHGTERIHVQANSLWAWRGNPADTAGNAVQGTVHYRTPVPSQMHTPDNPTITLHPDGGWVLSIDSGTEESEAASILAFLHNSGYPFSGPIRKERLILPDRYLIELHGFRSEQAAHHLGALLSPLLPETHEHSVYLKP